SEYYTKQLASFRERYPAIDKLTFSGRFSDRRFLPALSRADWEAVTADLIARLDDAAIAKALARLPAELPAAQREELQRLLLARRAALPEASRDFYALLAKEVDVHASADAERIEVQRLAGGALRISTPSFARTFLSSETDEVRLYTQGNAVVE